MPKTKRRKRHRILALVAAGAMALVVVLIVAIVIVVLRRPETPQTALPPTAVPSAAVPPRSTIANQVATSFTEEITPPAGDSASASRTYLAAYPSPTFTCPTTRSVLAW